MLRLLLLGEGVTLWWGLFDNELFVEHDEQRFGPYRPIGGPIPLHRYRKFAKTKAERRADTIQALARQISVPKSALTGIVNDPIEPVLINQPKIPFPEPVSDDPCFPNAIAAKLAIAHYLGRPLGSLPLESRAFVADLVSSTLDKHEVLSRVKGYFTRKTGKR